MPKGLRDAIAEGKKILVLINPPYAEAANTTNISVNQQETKTKDGVSSTKVSEFLMPDYAWANREVFVQFMARIAKEIPNATLAMFSTLKYVNAPNFEKFREQWNAKFLDGFIVHSKAFDGLKGDFPIGFLVWRTEQQTKKKTPITEISVQVLDKVAQAIGEKRFYHLPSHTYLNTWIDKPETNDEMALPLSNAVKVSSNPRVKKSCDVMIGFLYASNNDLQHAGQETCITSSIYTGGNGGGLYITPENLWQAAIVFSVRRLIKPTWINDRDQFLQPTAPLTDEFKLDCLIWMLFNGSNLTASADGLVWNEREWSIVNHFIPFREHEVDANGRFESDFMVRYLEDQTDKTPLSAEAAAVMAAGKLLWRAYFSRTDTRAVRDELKLNRPDVGWYQIRNALKARNDERKAMGELSFVDFSNFETAYRALGDKLRPMVYSLGFLRE